MPTGGYISLSSITTTTPLSSINSITVCNMHLLRKPHKKRRVGAKKEPTVKSLYQCGRWSLRCTKSRQDRVCVMAPCNKRKRSLTKKSFPGENGIPSTAKQTAKPQTEEVTECGKCSKMSTSTSRELTLGSGNDTGSVPSVCTEAFPIRECLSVLDGLEGIDPNQYNKALTMFKDERWCEMFILMPLHRKVHWVINLQ